MSPKTLPENPSLKYLKAQARDLHKACQSGTTEALAHLQAQHPQASPAGKIQLHDAQLVIARDYGFPSWRALKAHVDRINQSRLQTNTSVEEQLIHAAESGNASELARLLDAHPQYIHQTGGTWNQPLGHLVATKGSLACLKLLEARGYDFRQRCEGDNAYALHFAAEQGHLEVVKHLLEWTGDVDGLGDLHERGILGWATCFGKVQEDVAAFLIEQGATTDIFSAVSLNRENDVRRFIANDSSEISRTMSRFEFHRQPLAHAVRMNRPKMVRLLLELGADANARDDEKISVLAEVRGDAQSSIPQALLEAGAQLGLVEALSAKRFEEADAYFNQHPNCLKQGEANENLLVLMAAKSHVTGVRWLLDHGADANAKRMMWDCNGTALHFAIEQNRLDIIEALLNAGADPHIRDDKHNGDAFGWAQYLDRHEAAALLKRYS